MKAGAMKAGVVKAARAPAGGRGDAARATLRLECLRLALARGGANDPRPCLAIAEDFFGWVTAGDPAESA